MNKLNWKVIIILVDKICNINEVHLLENIISSDDSPILVIAEEFFYR